MLVNIYSVHVLIRVVWITSNAESDRCRWLDPQLIIDRRSSTTETGWIQPFVLLTPNLHLLESGPHVPRQNRKFERTWNIRHDRSVSASAVDEVVRGSTCGQLLHQTVSELPCVGGGVLSWHSTNHRHWRLGHRRLRFRFYLLPIPAHHYHRHQYHHRRRHNNRICKTSISVARYYIGNSAGFAIRIRSRVPFSPSQRRVYSHRQAANT